MKRPKKHYAVYLVGTGEGCYKKDYCKKFLGEVYAVSEKQACNYVRYRQRCNEYHHGGYSTYYIDDYADEGFVELKYEAIEID